MSGHSNWRLNVQGWLQGQETECREKRIADADSSASEDECRVRSEESNYISEDEERAVVHFTANFMSQWCPKVLKVSVKH